MECPSCHTDTSENGTGRCPRCDADSQINPLLNLIVALAIICAVWRFGHHRKAVALLFVFLAIANTLYILGGYVLFAVVRKLEIKRVTLFLGTLMKLNMGRVPMRIGWFPLTSSVSYTSNRLSGLGTSGLRVWEDLTPLERLSLTMSGPLLCLIVGLLILQSHVGILAFSGELRHAVMSTLNPSVRRDLLLRGLLQLEQGSWLIGLGGVMVLNALVNLLPLPGVTSGGVALAQLWELITSFSIPPRVLNTLAFIGLLILLILVAPWAITLFSIIFGST